MATFIDRQIDDWEKRGVIDAQTALKLREDVGAGLSRANGTSAAKSARRFSFFQVVAFFAAISLAAAVLIFIAANWEYVPRLVRAIGVMVIMAVGYVGGALVNRRYGVRRGLVEEACYLVGGAAFVGGVALIGQMYHISGDAREAALLYAAGLGLSGFAMRSRALVAVAAGWMLYWHLDGPDADNLLSLQFVIFAAAVVVGIAFATIMKAVWLRRFLYIVGIVGLLPFVGQFLDDVLEFLVDVYESIPETIRVLGWLALLALMSLAMLFARLKPASAGGAPLVSGRGAGATFALGLIALAFLHGELQSDGGLILASSLAVVFVLVALFAHGRDRRVIRYISYVIFVGEIFVVYGSTVYSMLGTSGFFLALGLVLAVIAFAVYRLERLWKARKAREAGDA
ncbi:DUF2157 domain-containing protein [Oricola sp.]|uniref:DUF2157 domain-containing protein n=1 Tax=Oricola sp. TaxID=1979950 RepID=UPI0025F06A7E|nr:DUF2157 domain-containing protein [Oricola sp.]MCI5073770.1 DUF2157 domain-containing protein [Oricola sp.]